MTTRMRPRRRLWGRAALTLALMAIALSACNPDDLLEAKDPDIIDPADIRTPEAADALRIGALGRLSNATARQESMWLFGGMLADEWTTSSTFFQNDETDQRVVQASNSQMRDFYRSLHRVRTASNLAITALRELRRDSTTAIGEMYMARGFAELQLAQDFCSGQPLTDPNPTGTEFANGEPLSVQEVFQRALASFDSSLMVNASGGGAVGDTVRQAARVGRGRAYMGLNRYDLAAAAVAGVPTTFAYRITFNPASATNQIWSLNTSARRYSVGDSVEGNARNILVRNAIPFHSARDPRVVSAYSTVNQGRDTVRGQDGFTYSRTQSMYDRDTPIDLVNGIDARLMEAENHLRAGRAAEWLATLNALRGSPQRIGRINTAPADLPPLTDPGDDTRRVDLHFREMAFWQFSRGQRLGNLRRLVRQYNRAPDTVFPVGTFFKGNQYGPDMNFPVPQEELNNPNFQGCTDRNA